MDLNKLLTKLDTIKKKSDECEENFQNLLENTYKKDERLKEMYYSTLTKEDKEYIQIKDEYEKCISQFSLSYLEMSEWYVGPELDRKTYDKYKQKQMSKTYLDSPKDVVELYKIFAFYSIMEMVFGNIVK